MRITSEFPKGDPSKIIIGSEQVGIENTSISLGTTAKDAKLLVKEKKETLTNKKTSTLYCLKSLDDYRKDAKLKATPGLLFKDVPVFRPIEPENMIDEETKDITALAERLRTLRLTIEQDNASLNLDWEASDGSSILKRKQLSIDQRQASPARLGENWSCLDSRTRMDLNWVLQRLNQEDREAILGILQAFEKELAQKFRSIAQRRKQVKKRWLKIKMVMKMGGFHSSDEKTATDLSNKTSITSKKSAITRPKEKPLDLRECYEAALLSENQRLGWTKLVNPNETDGIKTIETKPSEEKGNNDLKYGEEEIVSTLSDQTIPLKLSTLRSSLSEWLYLDQGLPVVQQRIRAIRDYCLLVNRLTECTVHLAHDMQLARQILVQFKREPLKDHAGLVTAVCQLAAAQDPAITKTLLSILIDSLKASPLLETSLLEGISLVLHHARPEQVSLGHLNILLNLFVERSKNLGSDLPEGEVLQLMKAIGAVLSSMALISQCRAVQQAAWQQQQLKTQSKHTEDQKYASEGSFTHSLKRSQQWLQEKQKKALQALDGLEDKSGLAIIQKRDYEKLCQSLNDSIVKAVQNRFDLTAARSEQPELVFTLSLIRQALMRLAHREPSRSEQLLEGAQLFLGLIESAKNAVTDFSIKSLLETGNKLMAFINATPLGSKLREKTASEEDLPQPWFEHYLAFKTLVDNDQLAKFEEAIIESGQPTGLGATTAWNYFLTQSIIQLLERMVQWDSRDQVRQSSEQLLRFFHIPTLWQWPVQAEFLGIKSSSQDYLEGELSQAQGKTQAYPKFMEKTQKISHLDSQRLLRKAQRECQESDIHFQLHDYCVLQVRQARQDATWVQNDKRYVPVLAKSSLDAEEDTAELFYPVFHAFLQTRSTKEIKSKDIKEESKRLDSNSKTALLILGDAGTGKSFFIRRRHLLVCRHYFSRQLEENGDTFPLSFHLALNQMPIELPLEHYLGQQGFSENHIRELQAKGQLIIHLDGYDEWSSETQYPWVFAPKSFGAWAAPGRNQVIITCRSQYVQGNNRYREVFTPPQKTSTSSYGKDLDHPTLSEWVVTRLDTGGVMRLTQYYVADEQALGHKIFSVKDYLQQFKSSGIEDLVRTPIILLMALRVLPALRKRQGESVKILRLDIYREFIHQYMLEQRQRKLERGSEVRGLLEAAEGYAIQLALAFFAEDKAGVSYQPSASFSFALNNKSRWDDFFGPNQLDTTLSEIVPLRITTQRNIQEATTITQYSFVHKSMLDYFTACGLYKSLSELVVCLTEKPPQPPHLSMLGLGNQDEKSQEQKESVDIETTLPYLAFASIASDESVESGARLLSLALQWEALQHYAQEKHHWETTQRQRLFSSPWNARPINTEQVVIDFIYEILTAEENRWIVEQQNSQNSLNEIKEKTPKHVAQDEKKMDFPRELSPRMRFKQQMITLMQASKIYPELAQASANAVTVLCRIGMGVFSNLNFSGVRWPGADLVGSYWDQVKLNGADLSRTDLRHTWMNECDVENAQLQRVYFGEFPSIEVQDMILYFKVNPKKPAEIAIATGNDILIYDRVEYQIISKLEGHSGSVSCLSYSPDGLQLASGSGGQDKTVRLWDVHQGKLSHTLKGHSDVISQLSYSSDGLQLASASFGDETVRLWDVHQGKLSHALEGHSGGVNCLSYSPNGLQLASGSGEQDETVRLWDVHQGKLSHILEGHSGGVKCLSYSPDGLQLASGGSEDETVRLWNVYQGKLSHTLEGHSGGVKCLSYSPDGLQLASGGQDKTVRLWDVNQGKLSHTLEGHSRGVNCLSYSPDGLQLASGGQDKTVRLWDARQGKLNRTLEHASVIWLVSYSPDGLQLASLGMMEKTVRLWDVHQGKLLSPVLEGYSDRVSCLSYSPDGLQLASSGFEDKTVRLWDVHQGKLNHTLEGHSGRVNCLSYSPDGLQLASSGAYDKTVQLWDVYQGKLSHTLEGHSGSVSCLSYSPDGLQLASGSYDKTVLLWDVRQGRSNHNLEGGHVVYCLSYSPDGLQLATGSEDKTVRLWDVHQGKLRHTLEGHSSRVNCLSYSPDGLQLATGSEDKTVRLWDVHQGKLRHTLEGHSDELSCLSYSPDGLQLASAAASRGIVTSGLDKTVRIWDSQTGKCLQVWNSPAPITRLLWRLNFLFIGGSNGLLAALQQNNQGLFSLLWVQCGKLPALSFNKSDFANVKGLTAAQTKLIEQRGGKIQDITEEETKSEQFSDQLGLFADSSFPLENKAYMPSMKITEEAEILEAVPGYSFFARKENEELEENEVGDEEDDEEESDIRFFSRTAMDYGVETKKSMESYSAGSLSTGNSASTLSTSPKLSSVVNIPSSLFGQSTLYNEEKRSKKTAILPPIPACQSSASSAPLEIETPRPRRYSAPGRL